jgi:hypothetical protein
MRAADVERNRIANGREFGNIVEWLHASFPMGPALGFGQHVITYEEALKLCGRSLGRSSHPRHARPEGQGRDARKHRTR